MCTTGYPKLIVSNQKEESICTQRVKHIQKFAADDFFKFLRCCNKLH